MADPIGSAARVTQHTVSGADDGGHVEQSAQTATPTPRPPTSQETVREEWSAQAHPHDDTPAPSDDAGPSMSGHELAAKMTTETASRNRAKETVRGLAEPLAQLAAKYPEPLSFLGSLAFKDTELSLGGFGAIVGSDEFRKAAARLSPREFEGQLQAAVAKAWPHLPQDTQLALASRLTREAGEHLRDSTAFKLQDKATQMLRDTAKDFRAATIDPERLRSLLERLNRSGESRQDAAQTKSLREALGLDPDQRKVSPEALTKALNERATLMESEAAKMRARGVPTLFRALAEHELGEGFMKQAGIAPGSFLAAQVDAVKARGDDEKETIARARLATAIATAVVTGGIGGAAFGIGTSLAVSAPSVAQAWAAVDEARAGESAGTMKAGAGRNAKLRAVVSTGEAVVSAVAGAAANAALHGVTEKLAAKVVAEELVKQAAHGVIDGAVHLGVEQAAHGVEHRLETEGEAGRNALQRAAE